MRLPKQNIIVLLPIIFLLAGCFQQAGQGLPQQTNLTLESITSGGSTTPTDSSVENTAGNSANATPQLAITIISPTREVPTVAAPEDSPSTEESNTLQQFVTPLPPLGPLTSTPLISQTPVATASGLITPTALLQVNSLDGCTYTVQPGDTLYRISLQHEISLAELRQANPEVSGDLIQPGQILQIPNCEPGGSSGVTGQATNTITPPTQSPEITSGGTTYTVQPGDTLFNIARRFGVTVQAIQDANNLANPNRLSIGQELIIPPPTG
jgi:LysM repeat protein